MKLNATQSAAVRAELAKVSALAREAEAAGDIETAMKALVTMRDSIIGAAIVLRAVEDEARSQALRKLETV